MQSVRNDDIEDVCKQQQANHAGQLKLLQQQEEDLTGQLRGVSKGIKLSQMPLENKYNKLHTESKLFMNIKNDLLLANL